MSDDEKKIIEQLTEKLDTLTKSFVSDYSERYKHYVRKDQFEELRKQIKEGFSGVHKRQDEANGKTAKTVERLYGVEKDVAIMDDKYGKVSTVQSENRADQREERVRKQAWNDRLIMWGGFAVITVVGWLLVSTGILNIPK